MGYIIEDVLVRDDPYRDWAPVLVDSPHSGRHYPAGFHFCCPIDVLRQAEDAWVEELVSAAPDAGATLLYALFPRCFIDANRAVDDIDPALIDGPWPTPLAPGDKSRQGLGLIRAVGRPGAPLYDGRLAVAEVAERIARFYHPYHYQIAGVMDAAVQRFGAAWYIDVHSMPTVGLPPGAPGRSGVDFVIGDRWGTSCATAFSDFVADRLGAMGYTVARNTPYAGMELIRRHGDPLNHRHALQLEINRSLYMCEETQEKHSGFAVLQADLTRLINDVCTYTLGQCLPIAADVAAE